MERDFINSIDEPSTCSSNRTGGGVIVDIGTGDGLFVYQSARRNPDKFFIGIDLQPAVLKKISEKIHRRPAKGGVANALFLQASVEELPPELDGVADEVHVHFPWGSLLKAVATGDAAVLSNLRRICASGALLEVVISIDPERDRSEMRRLGIGAITDHFVKSELTARYLAAGFAIKEHGLVGAADWPERLSTSWSRRLKGARARSLTYIIAEAVS